MKKNIKRIISLIVFSVLIMATLSACSSSGNSTTAAETSAETAAETTTVQETEETVYTENAQALADALAAEAEERVSNAGEPVRLIDISNDPDPDLYLPSSFDLRAVDTDGDGVTENYVTSVKQQRPFGSCWAFATMAAAETSILYELKQESVLTDSDGTTRDSLDLSEHHLAWFVYTPQPEDSDQAGEGLYSQVDGVSANSSLKMGSGSTQFAASALFASGIGPALEPDFDTASSPESELNYHGKELNTMHNERFNVTCYSDEDDWSVDETLRYEKSYLLEDTYFLSSPVKYDADGNYDITYAEKVSNTYKEQIMNGRPVSISYHSDTYRPDQEDKVAAYINSAGGTWAHYTYDNVRANHAVTIIGWDDDYPAENFLSEVQETDEDGNPLYNEDGTPKMKTVSQPPANGAWIVKNSWGANNSIGQGITESEWGVDGTGYFYLSYYDLSIETAECFDFDVDCNLSLALLDSGSYVLDQYDLMPSEIPHSVTTDFPVATANVFTAEKDQTLKAVSCTTTKSREEVTFTIYSFEVTDSGVNAVELGTYTETFTNPGLHVVQLPESYEIKEGQSFAVATTQKYEDGYLFSVGSEYNQKGFDAGFCDDKYAAEAVVNPNESYIYLAEDDYWLDFSIVKEKLESADGASSYLTYDNFPIKAYSSISE